MRHSFNRINSLRGIFAVGVFLAGMMAFGQTTADNVYRLQADDLIRVQLYRTSPNQDAIQADIPVDRNGDISAPFVSMLHAAGKTTSELENDLAAAYTKKLRLKNPIVSVTIVRFRRILATVGGGGINRAGQYEMRAGDRLLDLLNMGGGAFEDRADLNRAFLQRAGSRERVPVDLRAVLVYGDTSQNYLIQDGDSLTIPEQTKNRILILGAITSPGQFPYREPMTLSDAVALAHGEIRYLTKFSQTIVLRERPGLPGQYYKIVCDYTRFIKSNDQTQNIELKAGDLVYFAETNTPDVARIAQLAQGAYLFNSIGSLFGIRFP